MMPLVVSFFPWFHRHSLVINSFLLSFFFFFFLSFFLGQNKVMQSERGKLTSLPTPPRLPVLGNLHHLGSLARRSSLSSLPEKYGPLMPVYFGSVPTVIVSSAEAAREVMKTRDLAFASRPKSSMADGLLYNSHDVAFSPYSEFWWYVRACQAPERVQEEARKVVGLKEKIEEELPGEMHYLKAVNKEALRLHPPFPLLVPWKSIEDAKLQGYDIPAGTTLMINAWAIARDPRS